MYCSRTANTYINRVHTRALRAIYGDSCFNLNLDELLLIDSSSSIHVRNLRALLTEIFKSLNQQNPSFMWSLFIKKESPYDLRRSYLLKLPAVLTTKFGTKLLIFWGSLLWNSLPDNFKNSNKCEDFKKALLNWRSDNCTCHLCWSINYLFLYLLVWISYFFTTIVKPTLNKDNNNNRQHILVYLWPLSL
jgi:hypothetical protein